MNSLALSTLDLDMQGQVRTLSLMKLKQTPEEKGKLFQLFQLRQNVTDNRLKCLTQSLLVLLLLFSSLLVFSPLS